MHPRQDGRWRHRAHLVHHRRIHAGECLLLKATRSFPARWVIDALEEVMVCSGRKPQYVRSDNGPEFVAKSVQGWLLQAQVGPRYIKPGAPWEPSGLSNSFSVKVKLGDVIG